MATYNPNTTTAEMGNQNKAVADLQTQLNAKGANLKVDSKYGPLTQAAAAKYGVTVPSDVITSDKLVPTKPLNLPDAKPATFGGVDGAIDGLVQQQKVVDETPAQNEYLKALKESGYISSSVDRSAQDAAKKQSDLYTSQIEQEQLSNRRQIERLQKNMEGALASGISIESERLTRDSLSKQADLAILQTAANRNYDTAASIADRQVAMKMEQSRANLEALKMLDQREYGEITTRKEREYNKQLANEQAIMNIKLEAAKNGAGTSVLQKLSQIDTTKPDAFDKALIAAGGYTMSVSDRLRNLDAKSALAAGSKTLTEKEIKQLASNKNAQEAIVGIQAKNLLDDYNEMVRGFGRTPSPAQREQANSFLTNVLAPKLSVALGQGGMTGDEAKAKIDSLGLRGIRKREKVTWNNIDSTISGISSLIDTSISAVDSSIPGISDKYDIFKDYKTGKLPPQEQEQQKIVETNLSAIKEFRNAQVTDDEIVDYFVEQNPAKAELIRQLYQEGYPVESIIENI